MVRVSACHAEGREFESRHLRHTYGKKSLASRVIWEHVKSNIPAGFCVCHNCDNPACCEIKHLFLGTHADNMRDMVNKKRAHRSIGELSGNCKLTTTQVLCIRNDLRKQVDIARDYKVAKSTISVIKNYKSRIYG